MSSTSRAFAPAAYPVATSERDRWIVAHRPPRQPVNVRRPNAFLLERERAADGEIVDVATLFLAGRECPWRCLMCDLWQHTTVERTPAGAIPAQIDFALTAMGRSRREEALNSPRKKTAGKSVPPGQPGPVADSDGPFPLTPALSPGEREPARQRVENIDRFDASSATGEVHPLLGERAGVRGNDALELAGETIRSSGRSKSPGHLKLYNSGSFFDRAAIPFQDYESIAQQVAGFERVIVESHPALIGDATLRFRDLLSARATRGASEVHQVLECGGAPPPFERIGTCEAPTKHQSTGAVQDAGATFQAPKLEVAMGLETAHPGVLEQLNKRFNLDDFAHAADRLRQEAIALRVFVLIKPPFMSEAEGLEWAVRSAEFAFDCGATVVSLIPTRFGNGALEALAAQGHFAPPRLATVEAALERGIALGRGRVFADTWDLEKFSNCPTCFPRRRERLQRLNLEQQWSPPIRCERCS